MDVTIMVAQTPDRVALQTQTDLKRCERCKNHWRNSAQLRHHRGCLWQPSATADRLN